MTEQPSERKCPHCASMISKEAYVCPHCRKRVRYSRTTKGLLAIVGLLIAIPVLESLFGSKGGSPTPPMAPGVTQQSPSQGPQAKKGPPTSPVTPEARQKILATLRGEKDKFQQATFYRAPGAPVLGTHLVLYISDTPQGYGLRLEAQYEGADWVFWRTLEVMGDGDQVVSFQTGPLDVKRDNGSGKVWEVLDTRVAWGDKAGSTLEFVDGISPIFVALMKANRASVRFSGDHIHDHQMGPGELARFKEVGKKYLALFGVKN